MKQPKKLITFRISKDLVSKIDVVRRKNAIREAEVTGRVTVFKTRSAMIRMLIQDGLKFNRS